MIRDFSAMPKKKLEECTVDMNIQFTFRQPIGVDLKAIATKHDMKVQHILRYAVLEYLERNNLCA
jgi:hypothetical protein